MRLFVSIPLPKEIISELTHIQTELQISDTIQARQSLFRVSSRGSLPRASIKALATLDAPKGTAEPQVLETLQAVFIRPENLHITLAFIGKTEPDNLSKIIEQLNTLCVQKFSLILKNIEVDNRKNPKILWAGVNSFELTELAHALSQFIPETKRVFHGHITLARIKKITQEKQFFELLRIIKLKQITWQVTSFELIQSQLSHEGSCYTVLKEFRLE